jgi:hypothetical protein
MGGGMDIRGSIGTVTYEEKKKRKFASYFTSPEKGFFMM